VRQNVLQFASFEGFAQQFIGPLTIAFAWRIVGFFNGFGRDFGRQPEPIVGTFASEPIEDFTDFGARESQMRSASEPHRNEGTAA